MDMMNVFHFILAYWMYWRDKMFGFLSGIQAKFVTAIIMILMLAAAWFYVKNLESSLDAARSKLTQLKDVISSQSLEINNMKEDVIRMNNVQSNFSAKINEVEVNIKKSIKPLYVTKTGKDRDFKKIINKKPDLLEKIINRGTKDSLRCNEIVTGAILTQAERAGKTKNTVCPELLGVRK